MSTLSKPIPDPAQQRRKVSPDWLVYERRPSSVIVHRFTDLARAEQFHDEHQELDTDDRAFDARREEGAR